MTHPDPESCPSCGRYSHDRSRLPEGETCGSQDCKEAYSMGLTLDELHQARRDELVADARRWYAEDDYDALADALTELLDSDPSESEKATAATLALSAGGRAARVAASRDDTVRLYGIALRCARDVAAVRELGDLIRRMEAA